jgi:tetratricopeptide (TPR) repeat protein
MPDEPAGPGSSPGARSDGFVPTLVPVAMETVATGSGGAGRSLPVVDRAMYAVEGEFAHGAMGRILSAHDRRLGRLVALKELRAADEDACARFVREALVTARLQHPGIVPIYEAGSWSDGSPFYAMRLVAGRTLDALVRDTVGLAARLALLPHLLAVAEAVAYAHSQGVVHRDLKPANVLVGAFGETVVVDWGLAKDLRATPHDLASGRVVPGDAADTVAGSVLGTPQYMAPEQARGEAVDARADVYALGAMLYVLLAGAPPRAGTTVDEVLAAAATRPPAPVESVQPDAPTDLVAIVAKATAFEPRHRYPDAGELALDLRRFLTGQLVRAHHYSARELLQRWARQHRAALAVAGVLGLALAAAVAVGFLAVRREARLAAAQRDRARLEATNAQQANAFLREMLGSADPRVEGRAVTVASLLDRAAARLDSLEDAEVRASLRLTLGQTYHGLGLLDEAERVLRRAVEERQALPGHHLRERAGATTALAGVLSERGEEQQAEALFRMALAECDTAGAGDSEEALAARAGLASTVQALGRLDEAEALQRDVLQRQTRALGPNHEAVAATLNNLGVVLGQRGAWAEAERLHRRALELVRSLKGERSPETASALATVATAVEAGGNTEAAEALSREALALRRELLGAEHPDTVRSIYALAYLLRSRGQPRQAEALCREALALRGRVLPETHPMVAGLLQVLGTSLLDEGRAREAEPALRESLALRRATLPPGHWLLASAESALGACLTLQRRYSEAEALLLPAHDRLVSALGPAHERVVEARRRLLDLYTRWGRAERADRYR